MGVNLVVVVYLAPLNLVKLAIAATCFAILSQETERLCGPFSGSRSKF